MNPPEAAERPPLDDIFDALPELGSAEYLRHVQTASTEELPAEVLSRAYRELAASGGEDEACRVTLGRLLGEKNGQPEYLKSLLYLARRSVPPHQYWQDTLDLYQDAVALILNVLPTERGRFAERAWNSFCYQRLMDAWRKRQGRRGERKEPARVEPRPGGEGHIPEPADEPASRPPWHGTLRPDKLEWLEGFVRRTLAEIADPFIRGVAEDQWLADDPAPISGSRNPEIGREPLTERFGKSRFQIHRALNAARARLLAALQTQREMEIDLEAFKG